MSRWWLLQLYLKSSQLTVRKRASHGDYSESRWQLQGNVLSQSHLLCDLPRDIELAAAAAGGAVASIWPHSLLQLRRVDKSATATTWKKETLFASTNRNLSSGWIDSSAPIRGREGRAGEHGTRTSTHAWPEFLKLNWPPVFLLGFLACLLSFFLFLIQPFFLGRLYTL